MKRKTGKHLLLLLFLLPLLILLQNFIQQGSQASLLKPDTCFTESFREQALSSVLYAELEERVLSDGEFADLLTTTMLNGKFFPKYLSGNREAYLRFKPKAYYDLRNCYLAVWKDLENFPIPIRNDREIWKEIFYENTFGAARSYGGSRTHEGCDLFGRVSQSGFYPVISMTDGKIEKIGWLPLGGYRIGIRSPHGGYFYYAHLASYEKYFQTGEAVEAGQILGFMGDTGYFVTYRNTDPLFSADLSDPTKPKIIGELKITGFSEYLHFYGENKLLGIGWETDPDTGSIEGLKCSMFDITDPSDVKEIDRIVLKNVSICDALSNYRAILASPDKNLFGFAYGLYKNSGTGDYYHTEEQYYYGLLSYSEEDGFVPGAYLNITQSGLFDDALTNTEYRTMRGIYISDTFYLVTENGISSYDMTDGYKLTDTLLWES